MNDAITVCMTMGRRPDLLRQTFESLGAELDGLPVLAINDFDDSETNEMFAQVCPQGRRIDLGCQVGHHAAVDALYVEVRTPFIFHLEDDWGFHRQGFLGQARALLQSDPGISIVCLRDVSDFPQSVDWGDAPRSVHDDAGNYVRLDHLHDQWHGFTFNPHLGRKALWERLGGFSRFRRERHISRHVRGGGAVHRLSGSRRLCPYRMGNQRDRGKGAAGEAVQELVPAQAVIRVPPAVLRAPGAKV